jgi:putative addiction module antidote
LRRQRISYSSTVPARGSKSMVTLRITTVGNSVGVVLPEEILERLRVENGDTLYVLDTPRGIELIAHDPEFVTQMEMAERVMQEDHDALKKLAG